jgi:hypothetical protein
MPAVTRQKLSRAFWAGFSTLTDLVHKQLLSTKGWRQMHR